MSAVIKGDRLLRNARVQRVLIERSEEGLSLNIRLKSEAADANEVEWRFDGVTQLRFRGDSIELISIVSLLCEDIKYLGWEGIRYRVKDDEEEFISFYCKAIREVAIESG